MYKINCNSRYLAINEQNAEVHEDNDNDIAEVNMYVQNHFTLVK